MRKTLSGCPYLLRTDISAGCVEDTPSGLADTQFAVQSSDDKGSWTFFCTASQRQPDGMYRYYRIPIKFKNAEVPKKAKTNRDTTTIKRGRFSVAAKDGETVLWMAYCRVPATDVGLERGLIALGLSANSCEPTSLSLQRREALLTSYKTRHKMSWEAGVHLKRSSADASGFGTIGWAIGFRSAGMSQWTCLRSSSWHRHRHRRRPLSS